MKKLAIITVIFKNYTILDDYFATLSKQTDTDFHVYVLDLTPKPQNYTYPPFVTYIHNKNEGYAYGINQGVKKALEDGYELFAAMNCDVTVKENFVENIKKSLKTNPTSITGAKIYYFPGFEYHKERYSEKEKGKI
ncbi:hypothetical protein COS52_04375, partial [Candidatus Roizmanbacteria bacterium CG03_land_8_20_14_0_80_39_12]